MEKNSPVLVGKPEYCATAALQLSQKSQFLYMWVGQIDAPSGSWYKAIYWISPANSLSSQGMDAETEVSCNEYSIKFKGILCTEFLSTY